MHQDFEYERAIAVAETSSETKAFSTPVIVAFVVGVAALIYACISAKIMGPEAITIFSMLPICAFFTFEALTSNAEWR